MNTPGLPLEGDYVYITLDCKDLDLLDDTLVEIKAQAKYVNGNVISEKKRSEHVEEKLSKSQLAHIDKSLKDYAEDADKTKDLGKNSLVKFKKNI